MKVIVSDEIRPLNGGKPVIIVGSRLRLPSNAVKQAEAAGPAGATSGCPACWPGLAADAWKARRTLGRVALLIDDRHVVVDLLQCPRCSRHFVSVFTECVAIDGGGPRRWTFVPMTPPEVTELEARGSQLTRAQIEAIGPDRRSLVHDRPWKGDTITCWSRGSSAGAHD